MVLLRLRLECRGRRRRVGDVAKLDPDFIDPCRRQAQEILQRGERHEHQTLVHRLEPGVKQPGYRVEIISHRTVVCRRQQNDLRPHLDADHGGELISHHDILGARSGQIRPLHHLGLQHGDLLLQARDDAEQLHPGRLMGRADQAVAVHTGTCSPNPGVGGNGGDQRADIRPVSPAQGQLNGAVRVVIRSVHLDIREKETGAALDHLRAQPGHQTRDEEQHGVSQADRRHGDQRAARIEPKIAPREPRQPSAHCFRFLRENVSSLIGLSKTMSSYVTVVCCPVLSRGRMTRRVGMSRPKRLLVLTVL